MRSTLGMWDPRGGKQSPCLVYETFDGKGWDEHVEYKSSGMLSSKLQTRKIFGRDTIHGTDNPRGFKWRGAGVLSWVTCECEVGHSGSSVMQLSNVSVGLRVQGRFRFWMVGDVGLRLEVYELSYRRPTQ